MAARAKKRAQLDFDLRIEDLKRDFYSLAFDVTPAWHIIHSIRRDTNATIAASSLSESEFSHLDVHKIISKLSESRANTFGFEIPDVTTRQQPANPTGFAAAGLTEEEASDAAPTPCEPAFPFAQPSPPFSPPSPPEAANIRNHSSNAMAKYYLIFTGSKFSIDEATSKASDDDIAILKDVVANVNNFLVCVTFNLSDDIDDKDEAAKINAALKSKRQLKRTADATEEVSQMLSNIDLTNPPKEPGDYIDKRHKKQVANLRCKLKNEMRKNIWAIAKPIHQRPTTMMPLQKSPRKRPQLRRRKPRQRRRAL